MDSITSSIFVFSQIGNYLRVGTGDTGDNGLNGLQNKDLSSLPTEIEIPSKVKSNSITYTVTTIGTYAFHRYYTLKRVLLPYTIERIEDYAFSYCYNLEYINIPSSCTFLGNSSIHCYNYSLPDGTESILYSGKGLLTVYFEPHPQIQQLGKYSISRKEKIEIYYFGKTSPNYVEDPFHRDVVTDLTIHAPYIRYFCGAPTIHIITCGNSPILPRSSVFIMIGYTELF